MSNLYYVEMDVILIPKPTEFGDYSTSGLSTTVIPNFSTATSGLSTIITPSGVVKTSASGISTAAIYGLSAGIFLTGICGALAVILITWNRKSKNRRTQRNVE